MYGPDSSRGSTSLPARSRILAALAVAVALVASSGCKPNVAKLREEQDKKMESDKRAAMAEYKAAYEAKPTDPVAMYLHCRALDDAKPQFELASKLVKDHPNFAWGHHLLGIILGERGDLEGWKREVQRAAELDPKEAKIQEVVRKASDLVVVEAGNGRKIFMALLEGRSAGGVADFDWMENYGRIKRGSGPGYEVLAASHSESGMLVVRLIVKNKTSDTLVVRSGYPWGQNGTCYTEDGYPVKPVEDQFLNLHGKENCLYCRAEGVRIKTGDVGVPNAVFPSAGKPLTRCVFSGLPDTTLLVKLGGKPGSGWSPPALDVGGKSP
jgi:hypothetical protein